MNTLKQLYIEIKRILPLIMVLVLSFMVFQDTSQLSVQLYKMSMVALVIATMNIVRQWLFGYIDLRTMIHLAIFKGNISAAIIFATIVMFLCVIIVITVV